MNKKIKTTDTDVRVTTSTIDVVELGGLSFEHDERYPWVDVYHIGDENKEFIDQIDDEDMPTIVSIEDLKILSLNWYSNNVEVVGNIEIVEETPTQEARKILEEQFKLLSKESKRCDHKCLHNITNAMLNIYATLYPCQYAQRMVKHVHMGD